MKKKIKGLLTFICLMILAVNISHAQVFVGGNRVISQFTPASLDEYRGYGAVVQRQVYLKESNFSLTPTFQISMLTDKQYNEFSPEFYTSVSLGIHINYDLISYEKFRITPFIGPSYFWVNGLRAGGVVLTPQQVDFHRMGVEGGFSFTYLHSERFSIKVFPLTYTWGTNDFVQGNMLGISFQIK